VYEYTVVTRPPGWLAGDVQGGAGGVAERPECSCPALGRGSMIRQYKPLEKSEDILVEVSRLTLSDPSEVLRFVNKWGRLGVGVPGEENYNFDAVTLTVKYLRLLRTL